MIKRSPEQIIDLLSKIPPETEAVLVGGAAVNVWATEYQDRIPELQQYLPFASEDLDFLGGKVEAAEFQETMGGNLQFPESFSPSPNTGILTTQIGNQNFRIDFLRNAFGLDSEMIANSAIPLQSKSLRDINLKIINPLLCVSGKLKAVMGLSQYGRQDLKHLKISILVAREYLKELAQTKEPRNTLNLIERIVKLARSDEGLQVQAKHQVDILHTIPIETIESLDHLQWKTFRQTRLPQIQTDLAKKRAKYQKVVARNQQKKKQAKPSIDQER